MRGLKLLLASAGVFQLGDLHEQPPIDKEAQSLTGFLRADQRQHLLVACVGLFLLDEADVDGLPVFGQRFPTVAGEVLAFAGVLAMPELLIQLIEQRDLPARFLGRVNELCPALWLLAQSGFVLAWDRDPGPAALGWHTDLGVGPAVLIALGADGIDSVLTWFVVV